MEEYREKRGDVGSQGKWNILRREARDVGSRGKQNIKEGLGGRERECVCNRVKRCKMRRRAKPLIPSHFQSFFTV